MVLWEITLGTAYFLGLKRTYRLALKIQRRLLSPKHPKFRAFVHRRTQAVFNVVLKVHKNIQERDIEAGRTLGNGILRWLDHMKPSAQIRVAPKSITAGDNTVNTSITKLAATSSFKKTLGNFQAKQSPMTDNRHMFTSSTNVWPKTPFPTLTTMLMQQARPSISGFQCRHMGVMRSSLGSDGFHGVIREDIKQWILRK